MQAFITTNRAMLLATGQQPLMKLEIFIPGPGWENIANLLDLTGVRKNYLKDVSFSSGGARMSPNPIAGQFSATINNEGNIFHPNHPTSRYRAYFQAGRQIKISLGGNYTGGIEYWQRIIGYMDEPEFSSDTHELTIKGLDYMRVLSDTKFTKELSALADTPIDNYWGSSWLTDSLATTLYGVELYKPSGGEDDEGDAAEIGAGEGDRAAPFWTVFADEDTEIISQGAIGPYSAFELKFIADTVDPAPWSMVRYINVCTVVAPTEYYVTFKYMRTAGSDPLQVRLYPPVGHDPYVKYGDSGDLDPVNNEWQTASFSFFAQDSVDLDLWFRCPVNGRSSTFRIDEISIKSTTGKITRTYDMPAACTGIYYVELDEGSGFKPVWPGKQKGDGWYYDSISNQFYFDEDKIVVAGDNNLLIYYFTAQNAEDVLADILVKAALGSPPYANRLAAINAMGGAPAVATGVSIDRAWFDGGSTYIEAIRKICERCNWRFYFNWNGDPKFVVAPTIGVPTFGAGFLPRHFTSPKLYQDTNEIRNRIVIEGEKKAELTGWEDNMPSELKYEVSDAPSIAGYGERTLNIKNHLFQTQISIGIMCETLLVAYRIPKWYLNFETPFNAVPLDIGDTVLVQELLDIALPEVTHTCLIRNADISQYNVTYKCELEGGNMIELLASIDDIDLNVIADTLLFTVPVGRGCIITEVVMRNADGAVGTAKWSCGFNATWDDVIVNACRTLTGATNYNVVPALADAVRGAAAEEFKINVQLGEPAARTCTVDVFGYLYWV